MGHIWEFSRSVSVHFGSASQNVPKLILKSPRIVPKSETAVLNDLFSRLCKHSAVESAQASLCLVKVEWVRSVSPCLSESISDVPIRRSSWLDTWQLIPRHDSQIQVTQSHPSQVRAKRGSDWPQIGQIWDFFRVEMYWNLIWISLEFIPFRANLTHFGPKSGWNCQLGGLTVKTLCSLEELIKCQFLWGWEV